MQGSERGGLLPISCFRSRHCSGVVTVGATTCTAGTPACTTEGLHARPQACLGRPVMTGFLGRSVTTEDPLSRKRWLNLCRDRDVGVTTGGLSCCVGLCRDSGHKQAQQTS